MEPGDFDVFKTPDSRFGWRAIAATSDDQVPVQITELEQATSPTSPKPGKRKAIIEQAQAGALPAAPDFSEPTHARLRAILAKLVTLSEAGDVEGLKAIEINPASTSPKAMARNRELVVVALEAWRAAA
jgi:hypothetical protein